MIDFLALDDVLIGLLEFIREGKLSAFEIWDERYPLETNYALSIIGVEHVSILISKSEQGWYRFEATPDTHIIPKFTGTILFGPDGERPQSYYNFIRLWQAVEHIHQPMTDVTPKDELEYLIERLMEKI